LVLLPFLQLVLGFIIYSCSLRWNISLAVVDVFMVDSTNLFFILLVTLLFPIILLISSYEMNTLANYMVLLLEVDLLLSSPLEISWSFLLHLTFLWFYWYSWSWAHLYLLYIELEPPSDYLFWLWLALFASLSTFFLVQPLFYYLSPLLLKFLYDQCILDYLKFMLNPILLYLYYWLG